MTTSVTTEITLNVNGEARQVTVDPDTPLLYVLRNDLGLKGPKFGCGLEQCSACKVLIDGADVPSCQLPVSHVQGAAVTTLEGLGTIDDLHPLQEAFLEEQAAQCGFCTAGMIIAAQGLLNRTRYPSDDDIRTALDNSLCRCGVYDRVRRAIKLRIGRPTEPIYELRNAPPLPEQTAASSDLPASLRHTPQLDSWIRVNADGTINIFSGKAELGQGIKTALAQIAAEELDVAMSRIRVITADTGQTPDEGSTTGSMSLETSTALRLAAAEARHFMLALAFEQLESQTPEMLLEVVDGAITDPATGRQTTYWDLMAGKRFGQPTTGFAHPKPPDKHQIVGQSEKRIDLPAKMTGVASYVHDMELPDMLYGRVVRPPGYHARLISVDDTAIRTMPGVIALVLDGSFLGVIATHESQAINAAGVLRQTAVWDYEKTLPPQESLYDDLLTKPAQSHLIVKGGGAVDDPIPVIAAPVNAAQTLSAAYHRPYHMHASLGPSAAVAQWVDGHLTIWSHTQGAFSLQAAVAHVLKMDTSHIRVIHVEGSGCYGHNGADDAGLDAALLARAVPGQPVMLKWTREDEHGWEPYGSAMVMQLQASLDADGMIIDWNHDVWSYSHSTRPSGSTEGSTLLAAWHRADSVQPPPPRIVRAPHFGDYRNAEPKYAFPRQRVVRHLVEDSPLRTSALRSLGAYANVFAIESFMDELAQAAGADPIAFRLRHLSDERAKAVLNAAAEKANWESRSRPANEGHGWGAAFVQYKNRQCYAAVIVELEVDRESGIIHLKRAFIAADAGQVVNPDGLSNQLEGGFMQGASWTLREQVTFDAQHITSLDWESYPILRFSDAPVIETVILNRPELPFLGSGEVTQNPAPAAIANAVYDAVGVRLTKIPFMPAVVKAAMNG